MHRTIGRALLVGFSILPPVAASRCHRRMGGQPFDNVQPSLALNYFVPLEGTHPSRRRRRREQTIGNVRIFAGNLAPAAASRTVSC
jgi:microcystin-dependent protein